MQKFWKLFVVEKFLLLDRDDGSDVLLEVSEMAHEDLLLFNKVIDILRVLLQDPFFLIRTRNLNITIEILQNPVSVGLGDLFQSIFHFGFAELFRTKEKL